MDYLSFSQYNTYTRCPRSWYLGKVRRAEETPTWFLPIGTAVHTMVENWLTSEVSADLLPTAEETFYPLITRQMEVEPDTSKWLAGGSKDSPVTEDRALQKVKDCFERALEYLDEWDVWEVEYDASGSLPGLEIPIKAYVDIIGEHKGKVVNGQRKGGKGPGIGDWKTGTQKPKDNFQLETYSALVLHNGFPSAQGGDTYSALKWGHWFMLDPNASKARPIDLSAVSPAEVGAKYQLVYKKMQAKMYQTKAAPFKCDYCFHRDNCKLIAGPTPRALHYDKAEEDGFPF